MGVTSSILVMVMPARVSARMAAWAPGRCCWTGCHLVHVLDNEFVELFFLECVGQAFSRTGCCKLSALVLSSLDHFASIAGGDGLGAGQCRWQS